MSPRSLSDLLPRPDPGRARRALRDVRHTMKQGFALVRETFDHTHLPPPMADIAGTLWRGVDKIAHEADAAASTVIRGFLGDAAGDDAGGDDAGGLVAALRRTLVSLDAGDLRVSDGAVREAMRELSGAAAGISETDRAGLLMHHLLAARAVRPRAPVESDATRGVTPSEVIFATILTELQDQSTDPARLSASIALANALGEEIRAAGSDSGALARLFAEFRAHV